jgi:hypothetical protein
MQYSPAAVPPLPDPLPDLLAPTGVHDHADGEIEDDLGKSALDAKIAHLPAAWQKFDRLVIPPPGICCLPAARCSPR